MVEKKITAPRLIKKNALLIFQRARVSGRSARSRRRQRDPGESRTR